MLKLNERYVVDEQGRRVSVILDMAYFERLVAKLDELLEELESLQEYDAAKASGDEAIPFEQAVSEIERARK